MKELSIEQKAKAYDEAIEKAKEYFNSPRTCFDIEQLCNIFPELKESEDERIRKALIEHIKSMFDGCCTKWSYKERDMIIAWLEKQGEQKPANTIEPKFKIGDKIIEKTFDECGCGTIIDIKDGKYIFDDGSFICIEEQGLWKLVEQKPADLLKGEDYGIDGLYAAIDILQKTLGEVDGYQSDDGILTHKCAISAVKELSKQKPSWSEEDLNFLTDIEYLLRVVKMENKSDNEYQRAEKCIDWLISLKDRILPQPKQEWSEEVESAIQLLEDIADEQEKDSCPYNANDLRIASQYLKSFRPQNTWKPSEEQMIAIDTAINVIGKGTLNGKQQIPL